MRLPLSGLRVLTMEQFGAGPFGSMYLADMGAEVIKIENPATGGDASRSMGPNYLGEHDSEYFQSLNINKKSMTLNLKTPQGRDVLARLAEKADCVMNNMRGNQPAKLGLDYATLGTCQPAHRLCPSVSLRPRQRACRVAWLRLSNAGGGGFFLGNRRARHTAGAVWSVGHRLSNRHHHRICRGRGHLRRISNRYRAVTWTSVCSTWHCMS